MSLVIANTDTATSPVTGARADIAPVPTNYAADWRVVSEKPGEVIVTNITAPVTKPETLRFAWSSVADVFKGSPLMASGVELAGDSKAGVSILVQLNTVGYDSGATAALFPVSANLVLKIPCGPAPTAADVLVLIKRLLGHLYGTKDTTIATRMDSLLRGVLTPVEL